MASVIFNTCLAFQAKTPLAWFRCRDYRGLAASKSGAGIQEVRKTRYIMANAHILTSELIRILPPKRATTKEWNRLQGRCGCARVVVLAASCADGDNLETTILR
jgi:hypothetical protein